ncbi:hypothetical protein ABZP36_035610 [Zizania latifolia]
MSSRIPQLLTAASLGAPPAHMAANAKLMVATDHGECQQLKDLVNKEEATTMLVVTSSCSSSNLQQQQQQGCCSRHSGGGRRHLSAAASSGMLRGLEGSELSSQQGRSRSRSICNA